MKFKIDYERIFLLIIFVFIGFILSFEFIFTFIILLIFPGFVLLDFLFDGKLDLIEKLILSIGMSLSLIPIITYICKFFIPLNLYTILTTLTIFLFLFLWNRKDNIGDFELEIRKEVKIGSLILVLILFFGLITRIMPILNMNAPLFADPAVEGTITKLIINNEGIPNTWQPFLNLELKHQPGFASIVSWFHIISKIPIPRLILLLTNLLHALFPLTIYLLVNSFFNNKFRRITSTLIALIAAFPTYIFVAGMNSGVTMYFIIPIILFLSFKNFTDMKHRELFLLSLLSIGTFLIHPLYLFFLVIFVPPYLAINWNESKEPIKSISILFVAVILLPTLFFLPEILNRFDQSSTTKNLATEQWNIQRGYINPKGEIKPSLFIDPIFMNFSNRSGFWYLYLNDLSLFFILEHLFGFIFIGIFFFSNYLIFKERNKYGYTALIWYSLLIFFGPLQTVLNLKFPGWQYIYPSRVKFLTMIPLSIILSFGFTRGSKIDLDRDLGAIWKVVPVFIILLLYLPIGMDFIYGHLSELSNGKGLSSSDNDGIEWLEENTERDAFVLNTIGDIEAGAFIGGPAQWIPTLANRRVVYPPSSLTEDLRRIQNRSILMEGLVSGKIGSRELMKDLRKYNVTHIFISDRLFSSRNKFDDVECDDFYNLDCCEPVFIKDGTCIFEVNYG